MTPIADHQTLSSPHTSHPIVKSLREQGISFVRIQWVDLTNVVRCRVIPMSSFDKLLRSERPAISISKAVLGLVGHDLAETFNGTGVWSYLLDLTSLKLCPYARRHASVMGWFHEASPSPARDLGISICPRTLLSNVVASIQQTHSVDLLVGFETEFVLMNPGSLGSVGYHAYSTTSALYTGCSEAVVLEEIVHALQSSGIEVEMYHAECSQGQYEVITGPLPPMQAADALVHTRETIYNIANKHGLRASLSPRPFQESAGSASHLHFSVRSSEPALEETVSIDGVQLRRCEASFIASLLDHLPSLVFLTCPTIPSYGRMKDGIWSGGTYACWGVEHRETAIRVCHPTSPAARNFELKMVDGTSNPYLAVAALVAAGSEGIRNQQTLTQRPLQGASSAIEMTASQREAYGISKRLPLTLQEARQMFQSNTLLRKALGDGFVDSYLHVNDAWNVYLTSHDDVLARIF
ncbi:glutamine synthetase [Coprinopsis cinerea AmutBmut pab1-1]|nr:glutamine synthetase [Coprinopsis cinerea AmutBmut pab1-1]